METDYAKYELTAKEKREFLVAGYIGTFAVLYLFYHSIVFSLIGGCMPYFLLNMYSQYMERKGELCLQHNLKTYCTLYLHLLP